ncbi:MAG: hypothetical protein OXG53_07135 [Chloroflexi bacterium]|nr:hypothetical protein [Chloroflexota bacterium]
MNRVFVFALALPICLFAYGRLIPRLSPASKILASIALLAQGLAAGFALGLLPLQSNMFWLWDLQRKYNIPSTLASTQLALVGSLALGAARLLRERPPWQSLYLAAAGIIFLFMALDEYYALHEQIQNWKRYYLALGATLVVAALLVAMRSPRRAWIWYFCFAIGLAIAGSGAVFIELLPVSCGAMGILHLEGCINFALWEESLEFLGVWLAMLAILGMFTDALPTPNTRIRHLLIAAPVVWLLSLALNSLVPQLESLLLAQPASIEYETKINLRGYRIDSAAGQVRLYIASKRGKIEGLGYTLDLVDADSGEALASQSQGAAPHSRYWMLEPGALLLYPQWMQIKLPALPPSGRAYWIVLTLWHKAEETQAPLPVLSSDHPLLSDTEVILAEYVAPPVSP